MQDLRNVYRKYKYDQRSCMLEYTNNFLCVIIRALFVTLYSLTYIFAGAFAGETLDTCATTLAGINLLHVLNVSLVNKLGRQKCASEVNSECDY